MYLQWHLDKAGNTALANGMFSLLRRHETWYRKDLAGSAEKSDDWLEVYRLNIASAVMKEDLVLVGRREGQRIDFITKRSQYRKGSFARNVLCSHCVAITCLVFNFIIFQRPRCTGLGSPPLCGMCAMTKSFLQLPAAKCKPAKRFFSDPSAFLATYCVQ